MNTNTHERARRGRARRISSIWLVPAVALAIGVWMAYDTVTSRGPLVTLDMRNAEGVEAGKTMVKVKDVAVGRVEDVRLSDDFSRALASIRMFEGTEDMLTEDARFWVVKPRVGREGISGLGTILSGAYIEMQPGRGERGQRDYRALPEPPVLTGNEEGIRVQLSSLEGNQLNPGDPVTFRGYTVGRIESAEFNIDEELNDFSVFIESPFDRLVTEDVRFWQNSGVSMQLGADGVRVDIGSLESVISGGITFDILGDTRYGDPVNDGAKFTLFRDQETARQEGFMHYADFVMLVEDSVRGLTAGAPIEFRGIRIGTVLQVPYLGDDDLGQTLMSERVPVLIRIEPERLGPRFAGFDMNIWQEQLEGLFERGLRAALRSGNLLTGALYVDLVLTDEMQYSAVDYDSDYPTFPVKSGGGSHLEQRVAALVDNLNEMDFAAIGRNTEEALAQMGTVTTQLSQLLEDPAMQDLPASIQRTLDELERMMAGYSTDAPAYNDLQRSMDSLNRILRDLEPFAEGLRERPSSLLFNPQAPADPEPRRRP